MAAARLRPVDPTLNVATIETPAPPAPEAPPDPTPLLKASLDETQGDEKRLKAELAALQAELKAKLDQCKPIEPPKPPPPPPQPQVAAEASATAAQAAAAQQASAPPTNRPPPGQLPCDWSGDSGGEGVTRNKHYLGDKPGFVAINYKLFVRPDDIKVMYRGQVLAGTGGPRSGRGGFGFDWNPVAGDYSVDVIVTGDRCWARAGTTPLPRAATLRNEMTAGPLLVSEPLQRYRALGLAGDPVWRAAGQLRAAIAARLSREHADLLAIPEVDPTRPPHRLVRAFRRRGAAASPKSDDAERAQMLDKVQRLHGELARPRRRDGEPRTLQRRAQLRPPAAPCTHRARRGNALRRGRQARS